MAHFHLHAHQGSCVTVNSHVDNQVLGQQCCWLTQASDTQLADEHEVPLPDPAVPLSAAAPVAEAEAALLLAATPTAEAAPLLAAAPAAPLPAAALGPAVLAAEPALGANAQPASAAQPAVRYPRQPFDGRGILGDKSPATPVFYNSTPDSQQPQPSRGQVRTSISHFVSELRLNSFAINVCVVCFKDLPE